VADHLSAAGRRSPSDEFRLPDFEAPLDLEARIKDMPSTAIVKGMFFQSLDDAAYAACGKHVGRGKWLAFKDYPVREWIRVLHDAAALAEPNVPRREGIRRLGATGYPTFAESMVGRVLLNFASRDFGAVLRLAPRIYALTGNSGTLSIEPLGDRKVIVQLRGYWDWIDAWHLGVFEGGMKALGVVGTVRVRIRSMCDGDLLVEWS
jgi:uncharacterized protein (TIGR02265 family)